MILQEGQLLGKIVFKILLLLGTTLVTPAWSTISITNEREFQLMEDSSYKNEPIKSKVVFYLYTRLNRDPEVLTPHDVESFESSHFNISKATKIVVHGFMDHLMRPMPQTTKDRFLENEDVNVIVVDWGKIAKSINYFYVAGETHDVGSYLAELLDFLVQQGCDPKTFHLVGHSLGAHISGFAGAGLKAGRPARITGLDPAKPLFHSVKSSKRLNSSDADFVDVIHTSGGSLGLKEPLGHADFYPNGGKNQPGCINFDFGHCRHVRSYQYFVESIQEGHIFPSMFCESDPSKAEHCISSDVLMGNKADPSARGLFFVTTNGQYPFAPVHP